MSSSVVISVLQVKVIFFAVSQIAKCIISLNWGISRLALCRGGST